MLKNNDLRYNKVKKDLELAYNSNGKLSASTKELILQYLQSPSNGLWDCIYSTVICLHEEDKKSTLWDAVYAVNSNFIKKRPKERVMANINDNFKEVAVWPELPTPIMIERALEWCLH